MGIKVAVKAKHPTRRAIDKVIYTPSNLLDIIDIEASRQILSMLETSHCALYVDDKFYPVDETNYEEQFELAVAKEDLTVDEDANFGLIKLDSFMEASEVTADLKKIQDGVEAYNGILHGTLLFVADYEALGNRNVTKNGFWVAFDFDKTGAAAAGYSAIKFADGTEVADGTNYLFLGEDKAAFDKAIIAMTATITVDEVSEDIAIKIKNKLQLKDINIPLAETEPVAETFVVTFDTQGGSEVAAQEVEAGEKATQPADPTKDANTFKGWFTTADGDTAFDFDQAIEADTTVYAQWTPQE